jgi:hypothetical protein
VGFLALSLEPDEGLVRRGVEQNRIQMPVAIAMEEMLAPLGVNQVPSTLFVGPDGRIVGAASGPRSRRFFQRHARALVDLAAR